MWVPIWRHTMTKTIYNWCPYDDISYDTKRWENGCPMCLSRREIKMAVDEAIYYDDHGRKQENRADALEAENEELKQSILMLQQVSGILCDKCGWAMKFPEELCRCELEQRVKMLRDALDQMDINICSAGDLMTKEDMQEAERLIALRDTVLEQTKG